MADRLWRAQVTIPLDGALPEDFMVNTWHFDDDDDPIAAPEDTRDWIMQMLTTFYQAIDGVLFPTQIESALTVKLYDMAEPTPRVPLFTETIPDIAPAASTMLPAETCLVLSYKAAVASGQNPAHRRGRIFLGPVAQSAASITNASLRPTPAVRQAVGDAAAVMENGIEHPGSPGFRCRWAVYSPTWHLGRDATPPNPKTGWPGSPAIPPHNIGEAFNDVVEGYVDDAFDTQRRRGPKHTTRYNWT